MPDLDDVEPVDLVEVPDDPTNQPPPGCDAGEEPEPAAAEEAGTEPGDDQ